MFLSFRGILTTIKMVKKDDFWSAVFGFLLGAIGVAVVTELSKPKCPRCKNKIDRGTPVCPHCGSLLEWT